jgi:hypothetical protein
LLYKRDHFWRYSQSIFLPELCGEWEGSFHCPAVHMQLVIWDLLKADPVINKAEQKACYYGCTDD